MVVKYKVTRTHQLLRTFLIKQHCYLGYVYVLRIKYSLSPAQKNNIGWYL